MDAVLVLVVAVGAGQGFDGERGRGFGVLLGLEVGQPFEAGEG